VLDGRWVLKGRGKLIDPDAACNPRPLEPPVTTTTFPFKEKMLGKSASSVS
jgi:hypothetical protein